MATLGLSDVTRGMFLLASVIQACAWVETRYHMLQYGPHQLINLILVLVGLGSSMFAWSSGKRRQSLHYGLGVFMIVGSLAIYLADRQCHIGAIASVASAI